MFACISCVSLQHVCAKQLLHMVVTAGWFDRRDMMTPGVVVSHEAFASLSLGVDFASAAAIPLLSHLLHNVLLTLTADDLAITITNL